MSKQDMEQPYKYTSVCGMHFRTQKVFEDHVKECETCQEGSSTLEVERSWRECHE